MYQQKPIHTLVLDTGAIIKNEPPVSTLLKQSESLATVPAIISEIKDAATRSRVESLLLPFLTLRSPKPESVKFVTDFARRTGDLSVLSRPDIEIIALVYEVECERNGGDWRLRRVPGQKRVNGAPPPKQEAAQDSETATVSDEPSSQVDTALGDEPQLTARDDATDHDDVSTTKVGERVVPSTTLHRDQKSDAAIDCDMSAAVTDMTLNDQKAPHGFNMEAKVDSAHNSSEAEDESNSDSEGWITPSNLKRKQAQDVGTSTSQASEPKMMQAAVLTTDFAMQNVILQMNLNLLSPSLSRVKHLKTFVLRCHACFQITKDMNKQFCGRCGQPSLTRVSCSTNSNGEFKLHLKKNMQWNTRGDKYSIPKAVHGSANGKVKGGGKGGWGNDLILAEDQKEYQRATRDVKKKERSLMDEDYLPGILTGDRGRAGGRVKVGAGRNVNSKKR